MTAERQFWIDEKGKRVEIQPFYSNLYIDERVSKVGEDFRLWDICDGLQRSYSLSKTQREVLAARLLVLVRANPDNCIHLVGVEKKELEIALERGGLNYYLPGLVQDGYLREKWVLGKVVVSPTRKLLLNQRIVNA